MIRHRLLSFAPFLLLGFIATITICFVLAVTVDNFTVVTAHRGDWTVTAARAVLLSRTDGIGVVHERNQPR